MSNRRSRGISLVQVIVVVGIVVLVAGIVVSATGPVRESVRQTHCVENLHQLHTAVLLYSEAYDASQEIPGLGRLSASVPRFGSRVLNPFLKDRRVKHCPDLPAALMSKVSMSYIWVPVPPDHQATSTGESAMIRAQGEEIDRVETAYPMFRCLIHDEVYYRPKDAGIDPVFYEPFVIEISVAGDIHRGRKPIGRVGSLIEAWSSIP